MMFLRYVLFQLDDSVLGQIALNCVNIENLDMGGVVSVDDLLLVSLAEHCPHLSYINIKGCTKVDGSLYIGGGWGWLLGHFVKGEGIITQM